MVAELITETGASLVAIAVIIDEASARVKATLYFTSRSQIHSWFEAPVDMHACLPR